MDFALCNLKIDSLDAELSHFVCRLAPPVENTMENSIVISSRFELTSQCFVDCQLVERDCMKIDLAPRLLNRFSSSIAQNPSGVSYLFEWWGPRRSYTSCAASRAKFSIEYGISATSTNRQHQFRERPHILMCCSKPG